MIDEEIKKSLDAPLDQARVAVRDAGRGRMVPYLEGWDLIACANAIFGYEGWSYEVMNIEALRSWDLTRTRRDTGEVYPVTVTLYQARVRVEALGAVRIDIGSSVTSEDSAEAHDTAMKGAATDGLKRALRTFGAQFGNDLYDKNGPREEAPRQGEARQQPEAARPQPQTARNAGGMANVGALLTWALTEHQLVKADVLKVLGHAEVSEITDFEGARAEIERRMREPVEALPF